MIANKWVTILVIALALYSFYKNQPSYYTASEEEQLQTQKLVNKLTEFVEVLSTSPKNKSLDSSPSSSGYSEIKIEDIAEDPNQTNTNTIANLESDVLKNNPNNEINEKLYSITYNLLHSVPGKLLMEKFLSSPNPNGNNHNQPVQYVNNSIIDVIEGDGEVTANCGDLVEVSYIIRLVDGKEIENTYKNNKKNTFQIGNREVIRGLEYAVIGMKEGGVRRLIVPPNFAYFNSKFDKEMLVGNEFVSIDVELVKIKSSVNRFQSKIKIFDNKKQDFSRQLLCSTRVDFTYKLSTVDEKILAQTTNVQSFVLGSSMVPDVINAAFLNISSESNRLVIFPASLLGGKKVSFLPKEIEIPANGTLLLDIYTFGRTE